MADWVPLTDLDEVLALDDHEVLDGYFDGKANEPRPGPNRSASYRHGWWNGQRDGGHREAHESDAILAAEHQRRARECAGPQVEGAGE